MLADLHNHTNASFDSWLHPKYLLRKLYGYGIQVVAVTDHDSVKNIEKAKAYAHKEQWVIPGFEIATSLGDVIGLFMDELPRSRDFMEIVDFIRENGGISVVPHPYRHDAKITAEHKEAFSHVDLIEGINGRTTLAQNIAAVKLATALKKPILAGSDAHTRFDVGRGFGVIDDVSSFDDLPHAIIKGMENVYFNKNSEFSTWASQLIKIYDARKFKRIPVMVHKALILMKRKVVAREEREVHGWLTRDQLLNMG